MRNNYSAADHDPGDEDPTDRVKRALLEVLEDQVPAPLCDCEPKTWRCPRPIECAAANPISLGDVWVGTTQPDAATLAEILGLGRV